ncbi:MAG: hypothetical protein FXV80_06280 [Candidatus Thioglobus sp.]|nr:MAG: hypothetical protein FXV80_06280 [Candidatus Thioglobus sp.]
MPEFSLSSLDAINQIGIALLLAYLSLERYRYRKKPLESVKRKLGDVINNSGVDDITEYESYKTLESFSSNLETINSKFSSKNIINLPANLGIKAKVLLAYFSSNLDRYLTFVFCILLASSMIFATNYYLSVYALLSQYLTEVFYITMFFIAFPLLNIALGVWMQKRLLNIVKGYANEIDKTIETIKQSNNKAIEKVSTDHLQKP